MKYSPVDLHKKKSDALIIGCADPRFQSSYRQVIDALGYYHDLLAIPGASKAIIDDKKMIATIKLLYDLHHFKIVHILDHIECGAFGPVDNEIEIHSKMINQAAKVIRKNLPQLEVRGHLLTHNKALIVESKG